MVKRFPLTIAAAVFCTTLSPAWAGRFQFKLEYSKPEIFQGESVNANFILTGDEDAVEVEVARFPEFRGFWSENIALRQGPIPMIPDFPARLFKTALIGAYRITPMATRNQVAVNPMKIVIKSFMDPIESREPEYLESVVGSLRILPLPPLPPEIPTAKFRGAVGTLAFRAESSQVFFQKDEPTQLRLMVQGDANFQEMNEIPVTFPPDVEVLSKRSYVSGGAQMTTKIFDITLVPHLAKDFEVSDVALVWFDPVLRGYQLRSLEPIRFTHEAKPAPDLMFDRNMIQWDPVAKSWTNYVPISRRPWLWLLQALLAVGLLLATLREIHRRKVWAANQTPRVRWRKHLEEVRGLFTAQSWDAMLGQADELAFSWLKELGSLPSAVVRRREALALARGKVSAQTLQSCEKIFEAREKFAYRGIRPPPAPTQEVMQSLEALYSEVS